MSEIHIGLENPTIILMPIREEAKELLEQEFMGDENIYVLYKLKKDGDIHIGMMSNSMRNYFPFLANMTAFDNAVQCAYFYSGLSEEEAKQVTDRPVYMVYPSDVRTVAEASLMNATAENGLAVHINDVVSGKYYVKQIKGSVLEKTIFKS